jgi:hypothetical protein
LALKFLHSRNANVDPEDFAIWPLRIAAAIILAGPVFVMVGLTCWLALLGDETVRGRTKIVIGVCLALSLRLTLAQWIRFLSLGDR